MLKVVVAFVIGFAATAAPAQDTSLADEKSAATETANEAAAAPVSADASKATPGFVLPPGFKVKKRGKYTLYCKIDTPIGTRFKSEQCYDDNQMRDYMIALKENKSNVDRIRATCATACACGQPEAC